MDSYGFEYFSFYIFVFASFMHPYMLWVCVYRSNSITHRPRFCPFKLDWFQCEKCACDSIGRAVVIVYSASVKLIFMHFSLFPKPLFMIDQFDFVRWTIFSTRKFNFSQEFWWLIFKCIDRKMSVALASPHHHDVVWHDRRRKKINTPSNDIKLNKRRRRIISFHLR